MNRGLDTRRIRETVDSTTSAAFRFHLRPNLSTPFGKLQMHTANGLFLAALATLTVGIVMATAEDGPIVAQGVPTQPILLQPVSSSGQPPQLTTAGDMIGFSRELGDGVQAITLINASQRWMAVYHIDAAGQIRLASSRPLDADFTIQFNATSPLPDEIRRLQGK